MATVSVHPPKTPVTKGSNTVAAATIPNVCKMPGPPAPFVPAPLPNIGRSALSPKGYSKKVKVEGNPVAIGGATFNSQGDMASKGTGGGLLSANTHGITKFIMPGSFTVKIESKAVHLLGEPMLNNCGPSGSPPNAATMMGAIHSAAQAEEAGFMVIECKDGMANGEPFDKCETEEICQKCEEINAKAKKGKLKRLPKKDYKANRKAGNAECASLNYYARKGEAADLGFACKTKKCNDDMKKKAKNADPPYSGFSPDHRVEIQLGGHPTSAKNLKWMSSRVNSWMGNKLKAPKKPTKSHYKGFRVKKHKGVWADCC